MGMRCDQFAGLNPWATEFVLGEPVFVCTEEVVRVYPEGRRETMPPRQVFESSVKRELSGEDYEGMFGDAYELSRYVFSDGRIYYARLQAAPWSSGPVFFLALQDEAGSWVAESLLSEEEIEAA